MKTELTWGRERSKPHSHPESLQVHPTWHVFKSELVYFNRKTRNNHTVTMPLFHICLPGEHCLNLVANLAVRPVCFLRRREEGLELHWWGWGGGGVCRWRNHDWNIRYSIKFFYKRKLRLPLESIFIPSRNSYSVLGFVTLAQVLNWLRLCGFQWWGDAKNIFTPNSSCSPLLKVLSWHYCPNRACWLHVSLVHCIKQNHTNEGFSTI